MTRLHDPGELLDPVRSAAPQTSSTDAVRAVRTALLERLDRYLPGTRYRAYFRWALSTDNPDQGLFTRIIGLTQLGNLTAAMLADLPGPDDWPTLLRHAIPVNLYQIFEVVSDNLAMGAAPSRPGADSECRNLLLDFNALAAHDLHRPDHRPAAELLAPIAARCARFDAAERSLVPNLHAAITRRYAANEAGATGDEAAAALWSGLVANVESGRDVLAAISGTRSEPLVREWTIQRYRAVDRTLTGTELTRAELIDTCRRAILVVPTLAYFGAVFNEFRGPDYGYRTALRDGSLEEALGTAALLVRLQNDIGTPLLSRTPSARAALLRAWRKAHLRDGDTIVDFLTRAATYAPELNRFRKDLYHDEFNICLYDVYRARSVEDGMAAFREGLDYYSDLYTRQRSALAGQLAHLDRRLSDHRITEVTRRFVDFHHALYAHRYDDPRGDYAV
ncbi:hypothetical protein [Nocardia thraciensis]